MEQVSHSPDHRPYCSWRVLCTLCSLTMAHPEHTIMAPPDLVWNPWQLTNARVAAQAWRMLATPAT